MTQRRDLQLDTLDDLLSELNRLLTNGYVSRGKWNLGQCCFHCAEWARYPMDGFPTPPWFMRAMFAMLNAFGVTKKLKNSILTNGFKPGTPTAPDTVPRPDAVTDQAGVQLLTEVVERIKTHRGVLHPSPLFGDMDRELFIRVTLLHAQHHLGFLEPKSA